MVAASWRAQKDADADGAVRPPAKKPRTQSNVFDEDETQKGAYGKLAATIAERMEIAAAAAAAAIAGPDGWENGNLDDLVVLQGVTLGMAKAEIDFLMCRPRPGAQ